MTEKKVYILLTDTGTLFTKLIKLYTKKPYNHASISFDLELLEVYSFGRKTARNPFIGGFVKEDVNKGYPANYMNREVVFHRDCALNPHPARRICLSNTECARASNVVAEGNLSKE